MGENICRKNYSKPAPIADSVVIELDEMWHFLRSKKDKFGFRRLTAEQQNSSSIGNASRETLKHLENVRAIEKVDPKGLFCDHYSVYRDFIALEYLIRTKAGAHLIERDTFLQRHWFVRFR